ncbi:MAG: GNAT family N-acyltransferase [Terriglobus sp.]
MSTSVVLSPAIAYPFAAPTASPVIAEFGAYRARLAATQDDRFAAYRLRFVVFNLELNEGLAESYATGYDTDQYDDICDHIIVEHAGTGEIIGTYRLQSGDTAASYFGYYSEQEFDFAPYEHMRSSVLELGRACVHRDHRSAEVLNLLWKGIMRYAKSRGLRYLMGCCSLTSQSAEEGTAVFHTLQPYLIEPSLMTVPTQPFAMPMCDGMETMQDPPKLLRAYLAVGARICSTPAIDRSFGTIDFLTMIDLETMNPRIARRYL